MYEIEITRRGFFVANKDGVDEMIPVGKRLKVKELPKGKDNKYRVLKDPRAKGLTTAKGDKDPGTGEGDKDPGTGEGDKDPGTGEGEAK